MTAKPVEPSSEVKVPVGEATAIITLNCFCEAPMELRDSRFGKFWGCTRFPQCDGTVGAHPDGRPLGTVADSETKAARMLAHAAFDPIWQNCLTEYPKAEKSVRNKLKRVARRRCYYWLADKLELEFDDCHIGLFDRETCDKVIQVCEAVRYAEVRTWTKEVLGS